ncbi:MAG TPA: 4-hydroxy-tetrahydrodipicolinate reductase [Microbacteriaceae bacterium]|nr:4-hydroxy-tetrahydrodipicolinate reductase [Microbacteriaceae bacterium]
MKTKVAVAGASGRLGSLICSVIESHPEFELVARLGRNSKKDAALDAEILVDATNIDASLAIVDTALKRDQKVIIATSGWSEELIEELRSRVANTPKSGVLIVPNFSLGSVIGTQIAQIIAPYFDHVEIIETHHSKKIDSPSGTAVRTAELIAEARPDNPVTAPFTDQEARGQLVAGIPVHSLRMSGVVAKQEVRFGAVGETLSITHDTVSPDSYIAGIRASLEAIRDQKGLSVGLAKILGIK